MQHCRLHRHPRRPPTWPMPLPPRLPQSPLYVLSYDICCPCSTAHRSYLSSHLRDCASVRMRMCVRAWIRQEHRNAVATCDAQQHNTSKEKLLVRIAARRARATEVANKFHPQKVARLAGRLTAPDD
jgi:hypothetical protein